MSKIHSRLMVGAAMALGLTAASQAGAATFVLHDVGGAGANTLAGQGFQKAANFWAKTLTNNVTIELNIGFQSLGPGILGSTNSTQFGVTNIGVETLMNANANKSALDKVALAGLPTLDAGGNLDVITSGYQNPALKRGVDTTTKVFDNDDSGNNRSLAINSANAKALGFGGIPAGTIDGEIKFSSDFAFDFNPTDGIGNNSYDFLGIAIHEIGHALGFVSGVDTYDILGAPNGPLKTDTRNFNVFAINSPLDYFRYSSDPTNVAPGAGPALDWSVGTAAYFSLDKGATMFSLGGNTGLFSTGQFNGDGRQASHWKDNTYAGGANCSNPTKTPIGILDPTAGRCEELAVTGMDLAAFDVMGWNVNVNLLGHQDFKATTAQIYQNAFFVPEPATWVELIMGFGGLGMVARSNRRRQAIRVRC